LEAASEFYSRSASKVDIQHDANRFFEFVVCFECFRGLKRPAFVTVLGKQTPDPSKHPGVVIDHIYNLGILQEKTSGSDKNLKDDNGCHFPPLSASPLVAKVLLICAAGTSGNLTRKTASFLSLFYTQIEPASASMILRAIDNPIAIPCFGREKWLKNLF